MRPICSDPNFMTSYYYCAYDEMCFRTERANARYRRRTDHGDVCDDVAIACPC
ncbi:hypothetical protein [Ornithinibacillus bavariensis]|uniref:Uncharacterized protein n=1 Tax=Ornithinibacillus bavariensis TaxID=545502 RepID=A0A919XAB5_9BACI|nr:hypothetical protein [Ornithinibacillus bavariensis]GIO27420.1 hypothetical protein J43TS3_20310 [Ornithinibacillus bavariensis]